MKKCMLLTVLMGFLVQGINADPQWREFLIDGATNIIPAVVIGGVTGQVSGVITKVVGVTGGATSVIEYAVRSEGNVFPYIVKKKTFVKKVPFIVPLVTAVTVVGLSVVESKLRCNIINRVHDLFGSYNITHNKDLANTVARISSWATFLREFWLF